MKSIKKFTALILALTLMLLCCVNSTVSYAEVRPVDFFSFDAGLANDFETEAGANADDWLISSTNRALLTILLSADLIISNDAFDFNAVLLNPSYVGKVEGGTGKDYFIWFKNTDGDRTECIYYIFGEGAGYLSFDYEGSLNSFFQDACSIYYENDMDEIYKVLKEVFDLNVIVK